METVEPLLQSRQLAVLPKDLEGVLAEAHATRCRPLMQDLVQIVG